MLAGLILSLALVSAGGSGLTEHCIEASARTGTSRQEAVAPFPQAVRDQANRSAVAELVLCELEAGNVTEILFLLDGAAVARLTDGTAVEFRAGSSGSWLAAVAAQRGVVVVAGTTPDLRDETGSATSVTRAQGVSVGGLIALAGSALFGAWCLLWYVRRRRDRVVPAGGRARARLARSSEVPSTRFVDVAGCKEAIEDLREMVDALKNPGRYENVGARTPRGALLVGPPGTGKTLLARAVAGESGVPFFPVAGSDFVEMYVGVGARRVRDVFEKARKSGRAIVFIDEIDAVGRRRSNAAVHGGEQEQENTLIALLNELDGFRGSEVVVLAATNRPEVLDDALCRPGRLDRRIHVGLPDVAEREQILGVHLRDKPLEEGVALTTIARRTAGMSGAQLEHICNEAALLAAREGSSRLAHHHLEQAISYVATGRARRSAVVAEEDRTVTAWHEAGHTIVALRYPEACRPVAVSITPRGQAGGATWLQAPERVIISRGQLKANLVVALGGRSAEEVLLNGEHTAGAADDLRKATEIARTMVDRFGMTGRGLSVRDSSNEHSEEAVESLLQEAAAEARRLLEENRDLLDALVRELLVHEDLDEEAIARIEGLNPTRVLTPNHRGGEVPAP